MMIAPTKTVKKLFRALADEVYSRIDRKTGLGPEIAHVSKVAAAFGVGALVIISAAEGTKYAERNWLKRPCAPTACAQPHLNWN